MSADALSPETLAVRTGHARTVEGEHSEPLFLTSSFVFENAAQAADRFAGRATGNIYSRFTNPTVRCFEERLAALEGGACCIATASGMSAILALSMALLRAGDHVVAARNIFGASVGLFGTVLSRFGVETTFVPLVDLDAWRASVRPSTRLFYLESPSNPLTEVADIRALAGIAHDCGALLVVDNCFCTPALQRPLALGADLVIHSATKYLDGQGRCVGGAVVGPERLLGEDVFGFMRTAGPSMSPFNAWVFLKGLETLGIRMRAQSTAATEVAQWLEAQPAVSRVYYPGLSSHAQFELARTQQSAAGAIVTLDLTGGQAAAWRFIDRLRLFSITANLGDVKSTVTHPATTTHHRLTDVERAEVGIGPGLVRLSIGLESAADLTADLAQALAAVPS